MIILVLLLFSSFSSVYSMIGQPLNYTPARTPYWYRSQAINQEQARMRKYWKHQQQERLNQEIQSKYQSTMPIQENPEYMPD